MAKQTKHIFCTSSLCDLCSAKVMEEFDLYSPEQLSILPPVSRKQLLLQYPVVSICRLEETCAFSDIDVDVFWDDLLSNHRRRLGGFPRFDNVSELEALRVTYSSNRERYFAFLTTMIFSGDRFSGHYGVAECYEYERYKDSYADEGCVPINEPCPDDIVNYLVACRKPDLVHVAEEEIVEDPKRDDNIDEVSCRKPDLVYVAEEEIVEDPKRDDNIDEVSEKESSLESDNESDVEDSFEDKSFYFPLPVRVMFGAKCGRLYKNSIKGQHVSNDFSHYIQKESHYRLSDEDAIALIMNECSYYPKNLFIHEYEVMQWIWNYDLLEALLTRFFSKLERLQVYFRGRGYDVDYYVPGERYDTKDLELVLRSCFTSPVLTSVFIGGPVESCKGGLVLSSTLASKPCPSLTSIEIWCDGSGSSYDTECFFEALPVIITSHCKLGELTINLSRGLKVSPGSFSALYESLISFVQNQEFSKLTLHGSVPISTHLPSLLHSFLTTPCSQCQQICLDRIEPAFNEFKSTISFSGPPIHKAPSGALEFKSLFVGEYSQVTVDFCEWLFSHQPLSLKGFQFDVQIVALNEGWFRDSKEAVPLHLLPVNSSFHTKELSLTLFNNFEDPILRSILDQQQLKKLSLARHSHDVRCHIGNIATILALQHETLTDLTISSSMGLDVTIEATADMERFGDVVFSARNYKDLSLSIPVFWRKEYSKYIEVLYKNWLKHGCKNIMKFFLGRFTYDFERTDEISVMLDRMGVNIQ